MAIAFVGVAGNKAEATGTDVTVTVPVGVTAGNALLARYSFSGTGQTPNTPAGWTILAGPIDKSTIIREYLLGKVADGSEAGNSFTVSVPTSTATKRYLQLLAYSGTSSSPFAPIASFVETAAGTTHAAPTVNVTLSDCWIVEFASDRGSPGSTSWTKPAALTARDTQVGTGGGSMTVSAADSNATISPSGTAGGGTWTGTLSTANAVLWTVALIPASLASAPTGLAATPVSSTETDLTWDATAGATGYDVHRDGVSVATPATNSYNDTGLTPNTTYSYAVAATS